MKRIALLLGIAFASIAAFPNDGVYEASPSQLKVDQSFSDIPIETPLDNVRHRLTEIVVERCQEYGECDWKNAQGVRHYAFGFGEGENPDYRIVVKSVHADEFEGRPISALGIGMAREREAVVANIRRFLSNVDLECDPDPAMGCDAFLGPGWIRIWFDKEGRLREARFDGYHFT